MSGITIIEEHLCRVVELPALIGTGTFITLLCVGGLLLYILMYKQSTKSRTDKKNCTIFSALLIMICVAFWVGQLINYNKTHMEYTVIVDDTVSFNDFMEKYEIISIDGNEYRVKEK